MLTSFLYSIHCFTKLINHIFLSYAKTETKQKEATSLKKEKKSRLFWVTLHPKGEYEDYTWGYGQIPLDIYPLL